MIYRKMNYLTFDFDLWLWVQGHEKKLFFSVFGVASLVQNLNKIGPAISEKNVSCHNKKKKKNYNNKYRARTIIIVHANAEPDNYLSVSVSDYLQSLAYIWNYAKIKYI